MNVNKGHRVPLVTQLTTNLRYFVYLYWATFLHDNEQGSLHNPCFSITSISRVDLIFIQAHTFLSLFSSKFSLDFFLKSLLSIFSLFFFSNLPHLPKNLLTPKVRIISLIKLSLPYHRISQTI